MSAWWGSYSYAWCCTTGDVYCKHFASTPPPSLSFIPQQVPVFIWAPEEEVQFKPGQYARWWIKQSVLQFEALLRARGSHLVVLRATDASQALQLYVQETGASAVYFNHLYDPISLVRDLEVKATMQAMGVDCKSFNSDLLYEPWEVLDDKGQPYADFKSFWEW